MKTKSEQIDGLVEFLVEHQQYRIGKLGDPGTWKWDNGIPAAVERRAEAEFKSMYLMSYQRQRESGKSVDEALTMVADHLLRAALPDGTGRAGVLDDTEYRLRAQWAKNLLDDLMGMTSTMMARLLVQGRLEART